MANSSRSRSSGDSRAAPSPLLNDAEVKQLVHAAQRYDDRALSHIYQLYSDRIFRYIYFRVGEKNRAEELTGEVFVRLLESIANFRLGTQGHALALTGWIYRIAHNLIIDEYRRQKSHGEIDALPEDWAGVAEPDVPDDFHLTRADLQLALRHLTDEQQTVILLRFAEEMTSAEIAQILGKTETAVKALQRRGLAALARYLTPNVQTQA